MLRVGVRRRGWIGTVAALVALLVPAITTPVGAAPVDDGLADVWAY